MRIFSLIGQNSLEDLQNQHLLKLTEIALGMKIEVNEDFFPWLAKIPQRICTINIR
jgi:hypothetical protein